MGDDGERALRNSIRQLANHTALTADQALLSGQQWGLDVYQHTDEQGKLRYGYRWLRLDEGKWQPGQPEETVPEQLLPEGVTLNLERDGIDPGD